MINIAKSGQFMTVFRVVIIVVTISACARGEATDRAASVRFLAGGDEFLEFRQRYDQRVSDLTDLCLRRAGFETGKFKEDFGPPVPTVPPEEMNYYGIVDNLTLMQQHDEARSQVTPQVATQVSPEERSAYDEALHGTEMTLGCAQEARRASDSEFRIPEVEAIGHLVSEMAVDSGVADAYRIRVAEWSSCMRNQGIDGVFSRSAINGLVSEQWFRDLEDGGNSNRALALERSIYLADQECPSPTGESLLEDTAEKLLDTNPEIRKLLSQLMTN